ncbi:MAG TPA: rod shape-determining protein MreD [bacterium]|nr:rod shape-determining protein MreD [bacterium]
MIRQYALVLLAGAVAAVLQTTILSGMTRNLQVDFIFIIVVIVGLFKDPVHGSIWSAALGLTEDILSGSMSGIFMASCLCVFMAAQVIRERLSPDAPLSQFTIALALGLFDRVVLYILQGLFSPEPVALSGGLIAHVLLGALINAALVPVFFFVMSRLPGFIEMPRGPRAAV